MEIFFDFIKKVNNLSKLDLLEVMQLISEKFNYLEFCDHCIDILIRLNFTGPRHEFTENNLCIKTDFQTFIIEELTCEGEVPFKKCQGLILLWIAKEVSRMCMETETSAKNIYKGCFTFMKCVYIHQCSLRDERSPKLKAELDKCLELANFTKENDNQNEVDLLDEFQLLLMASYMKLYYYDDNGAQDLFVLCQSLLGFETNFKGALGKRTKFQQNNLCQLYLEITRHDVKTAALINKALESAGTKMLPNDHWVEDELLLEKIKFINVPDFEQPTLAEQALLVLQCELHYRSSPKDEITMEQCDSIIAAALGTSNSRISTWAIATEALLCRCLRRTNSSRKVERCLLQLEELCNQFANDIPPPDLRLNWFWLARVPSIWDLQLHLATVYLRENLVKSALDVILPWEQWKTIIDCHIQLGHREKAEGLIRQEMENNGETTELLCCLGDVTSDKIHYERAWEISKKRSARAMRSIAMHYMFAERNNVKAIECFELSLNINPMQISVWFTYGCCCMQTSEYRKAVGAFQRCVNLEPDNFEAWNNCASAFMELGEKKSALKKLEEAVKWSYENWRLWDNICMVSCDVRNYNLSIRAYHRLIDIRGQHRDAAVIIKIVQSVINKELDEAGKPTELLRPKLKELFARIASTDGRDGAIWKAQARLLVDDSDQSAESRKKILFSLSRSYYCYSQPGWQKDVNGRKVVLSANLLLVDRSIEYNIDLTSARLATRTSITLLDGLSDDDISQFDEDTVKLVSLTKEAFQKLQISL